MSLLFISFFALSGIVAGKIIFEKWFNHLTLYCFVMGGLIFLYELKLLPYHDIIPIAWFYIISAFLSFLFGIFTILSIRNLFFNESKCFEASLITLDIFLDKGKSVKYFLIFFGSVGLIAAIQNWLVLLGMFGSIPAVFLNAPIIYRMGIEGEIKGVIPYIFTFGYVAVFFAGIYTAYKGKFTFLTFFPFLGIVIREIAIVGRAGMLLGFLEFIFSFILFRHLLNSDVKQRFKFSRTNAFIASALLITFLVISASVVRLTRTPAGEKYRGADKELMQFKNNPIISPSIYLYLSSDVGVLSKYFEQGGEDVMLGQNTFLPVYRFLSRFGIVERPPDFLKGYFIPMWTNTGTYIRELHADFGITGVLFGSYLLGLLCTWLWFKFYVEKKTLAFVFLVYFYLIIGFSFLVVASRLAQWFISLILLVLCIPLVEKFSIYLYKRSNHLTNTNLSS
jgi:oligosaccharide repeat unit polymerase